MANSMKYLVTGKEMKCLDRNTSMHFHVPEILLMEQAAVAFVDAVMDVCHKMKPIIVICGTGNNGADGIAIARLLNQKGYPASIYIPFPDSSKTTEAFQVQYDIYTSYQYPISNSIDWDKDTSVMIDAVFGIGLSREITHKMAILIGHMEQKPGYKIAVDMPSGISADNGAVLGTAVHVNRTVTFSFGKIGQFLWPGTAYCGDVKVVPIGITMDSWLEQKPSVAVCEWKDVLMLHPRDIRSNKGTFGKLLVIAGSINMAGAAYLCAKAAYRTGCGLVKIITNESNRAAIFTLLPEAILDTYGDTFDEVHLEECMDWADGIVIGPGIGCGETAQKMTQKVLSYSTKPIVMDADALNIMSQKPSLWKNRKAEIIITPHLGEMSRLSSKSIADIQNHMIEASQEFAEAYQVTCVLKDAHTVTSTPDGTSYLNLSGNNGMATAGSGDVLSGIIGSLIVQHNSISKAASLGVFLHGLSGDEALLSNGTHGIIADDIIDGLKSIWKRVNEDEQK